MKFIDQLFTGALDIIGDVHGEVDALDALLGHLGYAVDGSHRGGRRLVFLGDLVDRGPDSPAVLKTVKALVEAGYAQLILGNHEMNLLRNVEKDGNSWWVNPDQSRCSKMPSRSDAGKRQCDASIPHYVADCAGARGHSDRACLLEQRSDRAPSVIVKMDGLSVLTLYKEYVAEINQRWASGSVGRMHLKNEWRVHGGRTQGP